MRNVVEHMNTEQGPGNREASAVTKEEVLKDKIMGAVDYIREKCDDIEDALGKAEWGALIRASTRLDYIADEVREIQPMVTEGIHKNLFEYEDEMDD